MNKMPLPDIFNQPDYEGLPKSEVARIVARSIIQANTIRCEVCGGTCESQVGQGLGGYCDYQCLGCQQRYIYDEGYRLELTPHQIALLKVAALGLESDASSTGSARVDAQEKVISR